MCCFQWLTQCTCVDITHKLTLSTKLLDVSILANHRRNMIGHYVHVGGDVLLGKSIIVPPKAGEQGHPLFAL